MAIQHAQEDINKRTVTEKSNATTNHRLPCRGCLSTCKNYQRCDGKPWRMQQ